MAQLFEGNRLLRKFLRYTVPMFITYFLHDVIWMIGQRVLSTGETFGLEKLQELIFFEYGHGSYYFALMIEFLFLSPLILWIIKRYNFHGVLLLGFLNFFYEICCGSYGIIYKLYRILIFRYLFAIALGIYIGLHKDKVIKNEYLIASFIVGLIYILLPVYFNYRYSFFTETAWASTSMIAVMYVFPVVYLILYYGHGHTGISRVGNLFELIGQSSYHIMCTQMLYFYVRPYFYQYIFDMSTLGKMAVMLFDSTVSLLTGIAFYHVDNRFLTGRLIRCISQLQVKNDSY